MKYSSSTVATFAFISSASAHLFMSSPTPITGNAIKDPLDPSGDNFPCHGVTPPFSGGQSMAVGSSNLLAFDTGSGANTAVHGGGSCQISLTYETDATKLKDPSSWKVLYSIEGGCPSNTPLNLNGNFVGPQGAYTGSYPCSDSRTNGYDCVNSFNFTIPQGVKNGQATLAWTWFNNVGNREMYMNCAAVDISGGASDDSAMSGLPSMFVANLASINGGACKTTEQEQVQFPNPGAYVTTRLASSNMAVSTAKNYPFTVPTSCGAVVAAATTATTAATTTTAAAVNTPATSAKTATTLATTSKAATTKAATTQAATSKTTSTKKVTTTSTKAQAAAAKTATTKSIAKAAAGNTGTGVSTSAAATATASTCAAGSVPCTGVNSVICVDSSHFGICDYNNCAISQAVAPGTACVNGAITWATSGRKRHIARHALRAEHAS